MKIINNFLPLGRNQLPLEIFFQTYDEKGKPSAIQVDFSLNHRELVEGMGHSELNAFFEETKQPLLKRALMMMPHDGKNTVYRSLKEIKYINIAIRIYKKSMPWSFFSVSWNDIENMELNNLFSTVDQ